MRRVPLALAASAGTVAWPTVAAAHAGGAAFILLLPTHLYVLGGALTVALSFVLVALVPTRLFARADALRLRLALPSLPGRRHLSTAASLLSLAVVIALVVAGVTGGRDPLANPLPLFVWSVWWIGLSYAHAVLGDLWAHLNPWSGLHHVVSAARPFRRWAEAPPLTYRQRAASWPAVAGFLAFAWFELIHPAPADPAVLAGVVAGYVLAHLAGVLLFGREWLRRAESFSVFFRMIAGVAPLALRPRARDARGSTELEVTAPTVRLLSVETPGPSGVAFVLLVLSAVSFDGLSRTFAWLGLLGVNPLVYPGRTALMAPNTLGLLGLFGVLALAYVLAVRLSAGAAFVVSLVPIACGYHFAHYLPAFLVDVQYALKAASDPFARGWDLLGTRDLHVVTSLLTDPSRVYTIWHTQVALIVAAHVAGVVVAHALALRLLGGGAVAVVGQLPLLALMVGYTMLGLWLLSTPAV